MDRGRANRENFLAMCLLDALEDEDLTFQFEMFLEKYGANPNYLILGRGIAPIHYSCGMENEEMGEKITALFFKYGANPNTISEEGVTPMHVACLTGRSIILKLLLEHGGDINAIDNERKTPVLYAVYESHFDCIKIIQNFVFEKKLEKKMIISANKMNNLSNPKKINKELLAVQKLDTNHLTPNRVNYNFDATSPYFINITHRRNKAVPKPMMTDDPVVIETDEKENLFELTEENLQEYTNRLSLEKSPFSLIQLWREKCKRSKNRSSILRYFDDIDTALAAFMTDDDLNFTNTRLNESAPAEPELRNSLNDTSFAILVDKVRNPKSPSDLSFVTAREDLDPKVPIDELNFIQSPRHSDFIVQMAEEYVHTDDDNGLVFYEKRFLTQPKEKPAVKTKNNLNQSHSSISTNITIPPDYDTEALRAELTMFGEPPGPITKSTKRLYTKRLIRYKRNPERMKNFDDNCGNGQNEAKYSMELERTVNKKDWFERIHEHMELEKKMSAYFQTNNQKRLKLREGNLKTSFIYMLIDPRISDNLPTESSYMSSHDVWKRFLKSVFYVGKGKSSRPYSHLYEAMKTFSRNREVVNIDGRLEIETQNAHLPAITHLFNSSRKEFDGDSKKLRHILDIWRSQKGVVCLHVFHNILPVEAYTREAAIIEAMGLSHLTNLKRGDFYGPCQSWTMRSRKFLGIALLYKAMLIFLAEGESQLLPSDLV